MFCLICLIVVALFASVLIICFSLSFELMILFISLLCIMVSHNYVYFQKIFQYEYICFLLFPILVLILVIISTFFCRTWLFFGVFSPVTFFSNVTKFTVQKTTKKSKTKADFLILDNYIVIRKIGDYFVIFILHPAKGSICSFKWGIHNDLSDFSFVKNYNGYLTDKESVECLGNLESSLVIVNMLPVGVFRCLYAILSGFLIKSSQPDKFFCKVVKPYIADLANKKLYKGGTANFFKNIRPCMFRLIKSDSNFLSDVRPKLPLFRHVKERRLNGLWAYIEFK